MPPELERCVEQVMNRAEMKRRYPDEKDRRSHAFAICNASIKTDEGHYFYVTKLADDAKLADNGWIQVLPICEVDHPKHGTIRIDEQKLNNMVQNFEANVRGITPDIDYAHKTDHAKGEKAAGWIKKLEARPDGLWALPEWTPNAKKEIADGEWRYLSAEYRDYWEGYNDVLFGAGLTNRPFMKRMAPINLSEVLQDDGDDPFTQPEGKVDPEDAHLRDASASDSRCLNCTFFRPGNQADEDGDNDGGSCLIVDGVIDPDDVCDYFRPIYNFQEASTDDPASLHLMGMMRLPASAYDAHLKNVHKLDPSGMSKKEKDAAHAKAHRGNVMYDDEDFEGIVKALDEDDSITVMKELEDSTVYKLADGNIGVYQFRDISQKQRDQMDAADFAGKGDSFPIDKCADVVPAFRSLGRAGSNNYDTATLRRNIIRIAKRKGCTLPKSAQNGNQLKEGGEQVDRKRLIEVLKLDEKATDEEIDVKLVELTTPKIDKAKKFAEDYPEEHAKFVALAEKDRRREADEVIRKLHEAGMPAAPDDKVRALLLGEETVKLAEGDDDVPVSPASVLLDVVRAGVVDQTDRSARGEKKELGEETFEGKVKQFMEDEQKAGRTVDFMKAATHVGKVEPELYSQWLRDPANI